MATCTVVGCLRPHRAIGYCNMHWMRHRTGIPLNLPKYYNRIAARGWVCGGYRWISTPDRGEILQHRYFMEKLLGRTLGVDEIVHHKNGNKLDNRVENLEIMARDKHTSHHRAHRIDCVICGNNDAHGAHGLCGKHNQSVANFKRRFPFTFPNELVAKTQMIIGLAWAIQSNTIQESIQKVLHADE